MYLAASVLTGYGMYLLAQYEMRNRRLLQTAEIEKQTSDRRPLCLATFIAGLAFAFNALRLGYGIAFTNLFHTEFIPFYVLFLLKTTRARGWKNAALAGL
ncbi:MAG: hypothetical protein DCC52_05150, partial [Chloroflexi bacterium]